MHSCGSSSLERGNETKITLSREAEERKDDFLLAAENAAMWLGDGRKHESGWFPLKPAKLWVSFPLSVAGMIFSRQPQEYRLPLLRSLDIILLVNYLKRKRNHDD